MANPFYPYGFRGDDYFSRTPIYSGLLSDPTFDEVTVALVEPVTLNEAKAHVNVTAADDEARITGFIKAARIKVEKRHNRSLVARIVTAYLSNGNGRVELPYPPVTGAITSMADIDGVAIVSTGYTIRGDLFKWVESPQSAYLKVVYPAGYTPSTIPANLKQEVLEEIAYLFTHRGDEKRENTSSKPWII